MKYLFILVVLMMMFSCKDHSKEFYYDLDLKVVKLGQNEDISADKYRTPISVRSMLLKDTVNNTYCIISNKKDYGENISRINITNERWYNTKVGDILHFDYIRKERFFKIKE